MPNKLYYIKLLRTKNIFKEFNEELYFAAEGFKKKINIFYYSVVLEYCNFSLLIFSVDQTYR